MNLREHVALGGIAAAGLVPLVGAEHAGIFWASSVLMDVDHYWDYLTRNGFSDWSPRRMFAFHHALFPSRIRRPDFLALDVFHTVEWLTFVGAAAAWLGSGALLAVLGGMVFHLGLDLGWLAWHRATWSRALSLVEYWIRRRALVRRGLDPDAPYEEALVEIGVRARRAEAPGRAREAQA